MPKVKLSELISQYQRNGGAMTEHGYRNLIFRAQDAGLEIESDIPMRFPGSGMEKLGTGFKGGIQQGVGMFEVGLGGALRAIGLPGEGLEQKGLVRQDRSAAEHFIPDMDYITQVAQAGGTSLPGMGTTVGGALLSLVPGLGWTALGGALLGGLQDATMEAGGVQSDIIRHRVGEGVDFSTPAGRAAIEREGGVAGESAPTFLGNLVLKSLMMGTTGAVVRSVGGRTLPQVLRQRLSQKPVKLTGVAKGGRTRFTNRVAAAQSRADVEKLTLGWRGRAARQGWARDLNRIAKSRINELPMSKWQMAGGIGRVVAGEMGEESTQSLMSQVNLGAAIGHEFNFKQMMMEGLVAAPLGLLGGTPAVMMHNMRARAAARAEVQTRAQEQNDLRRKKRARRGEPIETTNEETDQRPSLMTRIKEAESLDEIRELEVEYAVGLAQKTKGMTKQSETAAKNIRAAMLQRVAELRGDGDLDAAEAFLSEIDENTARDLAEAEERLANMPAEELEQQLKNDDPGLLNVNPKSRDNARVIQKYLIGSGYVEEKAYRGPGAAVFSNVDKDSYVTIDAKSELVILRDGGAQVTIPIKEYADTVRAEAAAVQETIAERKANPPAPAPDTATATGTVDVNYGKGENQVLSNLAHDPVEYRGIVFNTLEGAYHAFKSGKYVPGFEALSGPDAKKKGRSIKPDRQITSQLMYELVQTRAAHSGAFRSALRNTGTAKITHSVGDRFWSKEFPRILEKVRSEIFASDTAPAPDTAPASGSAPSPASEPDATEGARTPPPRSTPSTAPAPEQAQQAQAAPVPQQAARQDQPALRPGERIVPVPSDRMPTGHIPSIGSPTTLSMPTTPLIDKFGSLPSFPAMRLVGAVFGGRRKALLRRKPIRPGYYDAGGGKIVGVGLGDRGLFYIDHVEDMSEEHRKRLAAHFGMESWDAFVAKARNDKQLRDWIDGKTRKGKNQGLFIIGVEPIYDGSAKPTPLKKKPKRKSLKRPRKIKGRVKGTARSVVRMIISGGQTGADMAGQEIAMELGLEHGGFVPFNWRNEHSLHGSRDAATEADRKNLAKVTLHVEHAIRMMKAGLTALTGKGSASFDNRTEQNIVHSDGTLIFTLSPGSAGTRSAVAAARKHGKPYMIVDLAGWLAGIPTTDSAQIARFIIGNNIKVLNVAGNRQSAGYQNPSWNRGADTNPALNFGRSPISIEKVVYDILMSVMDTNETEIQAAADYVPVTRKSPPKIADIKKLRRYAEQVTEFDTSTPVIDEADASEVMGPAPSADEQAILDWQAVTQMMPEEFIQAIRDGRWSDVIRALEITSEQGRNEPFLFGPQTMPPTRTKKPKKKLPKRKGHLKVYERRAKLLVNYLNEQIPPWFKKATGLSLKVVHVGNGYKIRVNQRARVKSDTRTFRELKDELTVPLKGTVKGGRTRVYNLLSAAIYKTQIDTVFERWKEKAKAQGWIDELIAMVEVRNRELVYRAKNDRIAGEYQDSVAWQSNSHDLVDQRSQFDEDYDGPGGDWFYDGDALINTDLHSKNPHVRSMRLLDKYGFLETPFDSLEAAQAALAMVERDAEDAGLMAAGIVKTEDTQIINGKHHKIVKFWVVPLARPHKVVTSSTVTVKPPRSPELKKKVGIAKRRFARVQSSEKVENLFDEYTEDAVAEGWDLELGLMYLTALRRFDPDAATLRSAVRSAANQYYMVAKKYGLPWPPMLRVYRNAYQRDAVIPQAEIDRMFGEQRSVDAMTFLQENGEMALVQSRGHRGNVRVLVKDGEILALAPDAYEVVVEEAIGPGMEVVDVEVFAELGGVDRVGLADTGIDTRGDVQLMWAPVQSRVNQATGQRQGQMLPQHIADEFAEIRSEQEKDDRTVYVRELDLDDFEYQQGLAESSLAERIDEGANEIETDYVESYDMEC